MLRPGASLAAYKRAQARPPSRSSSASRGIPIARRGSAIKLSSEERERDPVRNVARVVQEEFAKELQKSSAYQVANDTPAPTCCASSRGSSTSTVTHPMSAPVARARWSRRSGT